MKEVDINELATVLGGARSVAGSSRYNAQLELAMTKMASDLKDIARPNQQAQTMTMMAMAMMAMRRMA
jgi:bacteriocin-like protein